MVTQVTERIRHWIVTGELPAGSFSITDLATRLGVSHIPVREAIRHLATEGLVTLRPARGGEVRPMNSDDVKGIYGLRLEIEPNLAAKGAALLTAEDLERLRAIMAESAGASDDEQISAHRQIYFGVMEHAMTEWDQRIWDYLFTANERYARFLLAADHGSDRDRETRLMEQEYLDIVETRNPKKVRAATIAHLERNQALILELLAERDGAG